jgi:hypothetical protein
MKSCAVESYAPSPRPSHFKPSLLAALQVDGPELCTLCRFYCSHIWEQIPHNVRECLSFTFPVSIFSCGALLQYIVYLVLIVIIFFRLITLNTRSKTTARFNTFPWLHSQLSQTILLYMKVQCGIHS